jgi:hypothetical protein
MPNGPRVFPADLRHLIFDTALGSDGSSLQNLNTAQLPDGASARVVGSNSVYVFFRNSQAAANGTTVIAPSGGPGRWLIQTNELDRSVPLLVVDNNEQARAWGWSQAQVENGTLGGTSAFELNFNGVATAGAGHGITRFRDGTIVVTTSGYDDDPNLETWFMFAPGSYALMGIQTPEVPPIVEAVSVLQVPVSGARVCLELPTGEVLMGRGSDYALYTRAQFDSRYWSSAVVTTGGIFAYQYCWHNGRLWQSNSNTIGSFTYEQLAAGGAQSFSKLYQGTNVSVATGDGTGAQGVAFDAEGNLWWVDYEANALKMLSAAGVEELGSVASNPTPTRVVTMPVGTEADGLAADATGLWVCETKEGGDVVHFAWTDLAASGSASPDKYLASPGDWPMVIWTPYVVT